MRIIFCTILLFFTASLSAQYKHLYEKLILDTTIINHAYTDVRLDGIAHDDDAIYYKLVKTGNNPNSEIIYKYRKSGELLWKKIISDTVKNMTPSNISIYAYNSKLGNINIDSTNNIVTITQGYDSLLGFFYLISRLNKNGNIPKIPSEIMKPAITFNKT